ncbi:MAG: CbtB domain-containing protein [Pseudomonadota bacterium]
MATSEPTRTLSLDLARQVLPAAAAILLGLFVLYGVGFAGSQILHNAAHDSRHSFAFPCH